MIVIALIFGIVQGLTEFLPVSSSGHLALGRMLFPGFQSPGLLFEILLHVATACAIIIFLRKDIKQIITSVVKPGGNDNNLNGARLLGMIIISSIPTAALGLGLKSFAEGAFSNKLILAGAYIVTGTLLVTTMFLKAGKRDINEIRISDALIIGVVQGLAVIPGVSRAGSTIAVAIFLGVLPIAAAKFSFLISLPAIFGAILLESRTLISTVSEIPSSLIPYAFGMISAGVIGYMALKILFAVTGKMRLNLFAPYCYLLAIAILLI
jgi:undecaprenyl-diphosphatase